jgi:hypothetical protein
MMHPSMAHEIIRQRGHDLREQARKAGDARAAHEAAKAARAAAKAQQAAAIPAIPDYVDGSFHEAGSRPHARA